MQIPSAAQVNLPPLREDLSIEQGGTFPGGAPSWLLHDPIQNRFFRIGRDTLELLCIWKSWSVEKFTKFASRKISRNVSPQEVEELARFLHANNLIDPLDGDSSSNFTKQEQAKKKSVLSTLVHSYLFFKIPLFNPQPILDALWPAARFLFTRGMVVFLGIMLLIALYLVSRQWEVFTSTFLSFLSFEGALFYVVSLVLLKFLHEFGHAFMAKKYGIHVPVIGLAFMVLFPVLYTNTTEAVRLKNHRQRLMIDFAGIMTELAIAIIATLLWVFLPDGPIRSIAFTTATLSWTLSLLINLNPFMRFDGYYILADAIGIENLQERGFAMAKWRMREILFKPGLPPPEIMNNDLRKFMIYHAWGTWIYRFLLFLGIALLVYGFFIKIVGIILFIIEILWFILLPVWRELKFWWNNKESYKTMRTAVSCLLFLGFILALFIPWSTRVDVPTVMKAGNELHLYPPENGQILEVNLKERRAVREGDVLLELSSHKLQADIAISTQRMQLLQARLNRSSASELELSSLTVLREEFEAEKQNLQGLMSKQRELVVRAPFSGILVNVDHELKKTQWVSKTSPVSILMQPDLIRLEGLAEADAIARMSEGQTGYYIPDGFFNERIPVRVSAIAAIAEVNLAETVLADFEGGLIPVTREEDGAIKPHGTWFRVEFQIATEDDDFHLYNKSRGVTVVEAERRSFASRIFRQTASVLIRESGF